MPRRCSHEPLKNARLPPLTRLSPNTGTDDALLKREVREGERDRGRVWRDKEQDGREEDVREGRKEERTE